MTDLDADVAVVGLGAWGSAALWRLARRGADVLGLERFEPGHALGSSHGGSRMFRLSCYEHRGLVPLAELSLALWRELEASTATRLLDQSGGLLIGDPEGRMIRETLANARDVGIAVECLDVTELEKRFPAHVDVAPDQVGVWEPSAGLLRPEAAVTAAVAAAVEHGARVHDDTRVTDIRLLADGVALRTPVREFRVRQAIVAVGAWSRTLFPRLPLRTIRRPMTWFRPSGAADDLCLERFPMFKRECADGRMLYGCGRYESADVKLGLEAKGEPAPREIDPDDLDRSTSSADWERASADIADMVAGVHPVPARVAVCMATQTPDGQFVLGRPGGDPRLIVAAGENSQGFKHASGIGEVLADTAFGQAPRLPLEFTDPDRF